MITPVNGHLLIEPLKQESFIAQERTTFQEIGVVIDFDHAINGGGALYDFGDGVSSTANIDLKLIKKGDKVYFDSWLAAKFPKNETEYYWLVEWENVRAIEYAEQKISK